MRRFDRSRGPQNEMLLLLHGQHKKLHEQEDAAQSSSHYEHATSGTDETKKKRKIPLLTAVPHLFSRLRIGEPVVHVHSNVCNL